MSAWMDGWTIIIIIGDVCQDEVWICMELMASCLEKLMKQLKEPIPECILGKVAVAVRVSFFYQ